MNRLRSASPAMFRAMSWADITIARPGWRLCARASRPGQKQSTMLKSGLLRPIVTNPRNVKLPSAEKVLSHNLAAERMITERTGMALKRVSEFDSDVGKVVYASVNGFATWMTYLLQQIRWDDAIAPRREFELACGGFRTGALASNSMANA